MRRGVSLVRRPAASRGRSERGMPETSLRERLTRLGASPRSRPQRSCRLPRGFEETVTPFGTAAVRQVVIPVPPLGPDPRSSSRVDTGALALGGGAGHFVVVAAVEDPI